MDWEYEQAFFPTVDVPEHGIRAASAIEVIRQVVGKDDGWEFVSMAPVPVQVGGQDALVEAARFNGNRIQQLTGQPQLVPGMLMIFRRPVQKKVQVET